ncbi:hypothetical protein L3Q82_020349, partial [Scortum barcoo]
PRESRLPTSYEIISTTIVFLKFFSQDLGSETPEEHVFSLTIALLDGINWASSTTVRNLCV